MIEIKYKTDMVKHGRTFELDIVGHANYADKGKDIVCAGVSALTIALVHSLNDMQKKKKVDNKMILVSGRTHIESLSKIYSDIIEVEATYNTVMKGFEHIANEYPNNVKIV